MTVGADLPPVAQSDVAAELAPLVPGADPARADRFRPSFAEAMRLYVAPEAPCTSVLCQMDPATFLALLTSYVMVCVFVMMIVPRFVALLREIAWVAFDLLARRR